MNVAVWCSSLFCPLGATVVFHTVYFICFIIRFIFCPGPWICSLFLRVAVSWLTKEGNKPHVESESLIHHMHSPHRRYLYMLSYSALSDQSQQYNCSTYSVSNIVPHNKQTLVFLK